jgi:mono/diheme cytochrome c family protein
MQAERFQESAGSQPEWVHKVSEHDTHSEQQLWGVVAEFETPQELMAAAERVRDAGYKRWDCLTPFAVHGLDDAMGVRPTILPWLTLGAGLSGLTIATLLQWWTNSVDYPFLISGKPLFSLPANIPVMFELTVLLSAFTTFLGMLALNLLPQWYHPLFRRVRHQRFSDDRFGVVIEAADPRFQREQVELLLSGAGAKLVEAVFAPKRRAPLPAAIHGVGVCVTIAALVPAGLAVKSRYAKSDEPRLHIVQDMDMQPKFKAQQANPLLEELWGDARASLLPVPGTVARGELRADDHRYRGMNAAGEFAADNALPLSEALLTRGQERFAIHCSPCHGVAGYGDGLVARRADRLEQGTWIPPLSLHDATVLAQPDGQLFNTITHGIRNMKAYGHQVPVDDRWAIVAYIRALQRSRTTSLDDVPADRRDSLR